MRKVLSTISLSCGVALCVSYAYKVYNGEQVDAVAAFLPWLMFLISEIRLLKEEQ